MKIYINKLKVTQFVTRAIFQVIPHTGKMPPTSVPRRINRYRRTLRAPRRLNLLSSNMVELKVGISLQMSRSPFHELDDYFVVIYWNLDLLGYD
ncbi:hypothetical protein NPIL_97711 [Nephila pilipes]|uniref:Uncharacterized protein n=2 Tax=Nephila pilipes TaxID=299642 RepID=A0A8X6IXD4_NEPPI|nr:hypothetical protein NPIL_97711 [Nephila pilipes]